MPRCGPGSYAKKNPSGVPGRRCASTNAVRSTRKKAHRLWREEGLQVRVHIPRLRAGVSSVPPVAADAANVVWAIGFQFDPSIDGKAIKIGHDQDPCTDHRRQSGLSCQPPACT